MITLQILAVLSIGLAAGYTTGYVLGFVNGHRKHRDEMLEFLDADDECIHTAARPTDAKVTALVN